MIWKKITCNKLKFCDFILKKENKTRKDNNNISEQINPIFLLQ